jgi:HAD superfamily hydrolase (TIGR01458 family)
MKKMPVLIDIDGVLRIGSAPAEGLSDFMDFLSDSSQPVCLISNSTLSSSDDIALFFKKNGIAHSFPIMTASTATVGFVRNNYSSAAVYAIPKIKKLFGDIVSESHSPEAVVMGDMGEAWDYEILSEIFLKVRSGADLIAMQKNRFWKTPEKGYLMDLGPFVAAVEYAANKDAILIGKPSKIYFNSALDILGYEEESRFIMIGDDIETDIIGAGKLGAITVQMYTGKTSYPLPPELRNIPDYHAKTLNETIKILKKILEIE